MKAAWWVLAEDNGSISIELYEYIKNLGFPFDCVDPTVPSTVVHENDTVIMSSKRGLFACPKNIKVNHLKRLIS